MPAAELGGFDGRLKGHTKVDRIQEKLQGPLVLLVQSHGAKSHKGLAIDARPSKESGWRVALCAGLSALGWCGSRTNLDTRGQGKPYAINDRRAGEPGATRRGRDQVARAIDDRHVYGATLPLSPDHKPGGAQGTTL